MPSSNVVWDMSGPLATLTFARPEARNALTWEMYDALAAACDEVEAGDARVLIIRGSEGAFSAGTDIAQFRELTSGPAGVAYERRIEAVIGRLERLTKITIAAIDGPAVGGGCAIAVACDLRLCADTARFGVPVSRTLGNCLSAENLARLADLIGVGRAVDVMLTGRLISADQALEWGLATRVSPVGELEADTLALAHDLATRAPSTVVATKQMLRRLREHRRLPAGACDDLIAACYASAEFREGVAAFAEKRKPAFV
ncbi:MAG: enoyl-CoA hydratase/isomerase family protein [Acidobacteria bacterium]|nr:enoyl-CoA hydratase/isomerase family protein [Acidobacteriota bacterium]